VPQPVEQLGRAAERRGGFDAIEDLGGIDVLCTDKTGTLTEGVITLDAAVDPQGRPDAEVKRLAFLNAALETGIENPLDAAIVAAGEKAGLSAAGLRKVDEIPYDFIRKRLTIVLEDGDAAGHLIVTKGAFSTVLAVCSVEPALRERCEAYYRDMSAQGYRVLAAKDGVDALEQMKDVLPAVMLVDIEMPRMDGFDLTRHLRGDPRTRAIPIIMISSRTAGKHRDQATQLGVNAFLGKPYPEVELLQHISRFLEAAHA